jgi:signal transduction histidine kinase
MSYPLIGRQSGLPRELSFMGNRRSLRKRFTADLQIQGALAVRVVLYWLLCLFAIGMLLFVLRMAAKPLTPLDRQLNDLWSLILPTAAVSLLLLPIVVLDVLRLTNRFAGPVFRLRRAMRDLAEGKTVEEIRFRKGDFWLEFASDFNAVAARLRQAEAEASGASDQPEEAELSCLVGMSK